MGLKMSLPQLDLENFFLLGSCGVGRRDRLDAVLGITKASARLLDIRGGSTGH